MTITADHNFTAHHTVDASPALGTAHALDGRRLVMRLVARLGAVSCVMVALLVWVAPGATWDGDVLLFKTALAMASILASVGMWQLSLPPAKPTVEVDMVNLEVRVMRNRSDGTAQVIERCAFEDLDKVDLNGRHIIFWTKSSRLLANITLNSAASYMSLLAALRGVGKIG